MKRTMNTDFVAVIRHAKSARKKEELFLTLKDEYSEALADLAREWVTDRAPSLRMVALDYLKAFGGAADSFRICMALNDPIWQNRCTAAEILVNYPAAEVKRCLIRRMLTDKHPHVRKYIGASLGYWSEPDVERLLLGLIKTEKRPHARSGILEGLIRLGHTEFLDEMLTALTNGDHIVRHETVSALRDLEFSETDSREVERALRTLVDVETNPGIRADAEQVIVEILSQIEGLDSPDSQELRP